MSRSQSARLFPLHALALAAAASISLPCGAAEQEQPVPPTRGGEPAVRHVVIEDQGSRVEELKVRGQVKRITVTPKVGPKVPYEVLPADGSRDLSQPGEKGTAGQRVWQVLSF